MGKNKTTKKPVSPIIVILYIVLALLVVIYVAPLLWMLCVSLKDQCSSHVWTVWPSEGTASGELCTGMDHGQAWSSPSELCTGLRCQSGSQSVFWIYGSICHCKNEMEAVGSGTYLFPDWYDGSGTLYSDSTVCTFCPSWADQQPVWTDDSVYYIFPANDNFPDDRILQEYAR